MYGFLLLSYNNFVCKRFTIKNAVTSKIGLGSLKVIVNVTVR